MSTQGLHMGGVRTLADLKARCEEVGECWEWQRYINSNNTPHVRYQGKPMSARRVAWEMVNGPVPDGKRIAYTCGNYRCICPAHSAAVTATAVLANNLANANEGLRRARIAATKRRQMGVSTAVVSAVKADATTLAATLASQLGVSEATVYKLRRQARAVSPWGGLMRGAA